MFQFATWTPAIEEFAADMLRVGMSPEQAADELGVPYDHVRDLIAESRDSHHEEELA